MYYFDIRFVITNHIIPRPLLLFQDHLDSACSGRDTSTDKSPHQQCIHFSRKKGARNKVKLQLELFKWWLFEQVIKM